MNATLSGHPQIILALQGGGALGAYHIGAYQALAEAGYHPDWVTGISIGAINAAIIAGNAPDRRVAQLEGFWRAISRPDEWGANLDGFARQVFNRLSVGQAIVLGQPRFFTPRLVAPNLAPPGTPAATSYYDPTPLVETLRRYADFELINHGPVRLSLGATKVTTGELVFFDSRRQSLGPEHVLASGSLPPGFPATRIDGELYWDGGCVANTPLQAVLSEPLAGPALIIAIDLWNPYGPEPETMDDVLWRQRQIQFASRTIHDVQMVAQMLNMRWLLGQLRERVPEAERGNLPRGLPVEPGRASVDLVHLVYQPRPDEVPQSAADFSRPSIAARRAAGYADMRRVLEQAPWQVTETAARVGARVHLVAGEVLTSYVPDL